MVKFTLNNIKFGKNNIPLDANFNFRDLVIIDNKSFIRSDNFAFLNMQTSKNNIDFYTYLKKDYPTANNCTFELSLGFTNNPKKIKKEIVSRKKIICDIYKDFILYKFSKKRYNHILKINT